MKNEKINILFLSKHVIHDKMAMAGHVSFYHTLLSFCADKRFRTALIVATPEKEHLKRMQAQFSGKLKNASLLIPRIWSLWTHLFYNSFLHTLLSCLRPQWYHLDPLYAFYYRKALKKLKKEGVQPDIIVFEWTEMIFLLPFCKKLFPAFRSAATEHDVSYIKISRRYGHNALLNKYFVKAYQKKELQMLHCMNLVNVLSSDDAHRLITAGIPPNKIQLLVPYYQVAEGERQPITDNSILFFGAMNRIENWEAVVWFIEKVFRPYQLGKDFRFIVMGGGLDTTFRQKWEQVPGVLFTGFVADPPAYFSKAFASVVPLTNGGGIKIKVLEAMAAGVPLLTNSIGMEGINAPKGTDYLHCEAPEDYVNGLMQLKQDPGRASLIGQHGKIFVSQHFNYENSVLRYREKLWEMGEEG